MTMKAIQYKAFGNSDVIQLLEVEKPSPKHNEVLVRIASATVNPFDIKVRQGDLQQQMPVDLPYFPGVDIAGTVELTGSGVTGFKKGDQVFGNVMGGGYAEYIICSEDMIYPIPSNMNLEEAAALAVPLNTSYSVLVENGALKSGQRVLIQGAAGGVGLVMVQMAKALGAYVIATVNGEGQELVKSLGADEVIDNKTQDFTQTVKDIDLVADLVGGGIQARSFEVVKPGGQLLGIVMPPSEELAKKHDVLIKFVFNKSSNRSKEFVNGLVEDGKIIPHIAKTFKLENAREAQDFLSAGGVHGKVLLTIRGN